MVFDLHMCRRELHHQPRTQTMYMSTEGPASVPDKLNYKASHSHIFDTHKIVTCAMMSEDNRSEH